MLRNGEMYALMGEHDAGKSTFTMGKELGRLSKISSKEVGTVGFERKRVYEVDRRSSAAEVKAFNFQVGKDEVSLILMRDRHSESTCSKRDHKG
jgi:ABC-type glutathione transport system ATPase component